MNIRVAENANSLAKLPAYYPKRSLGYTATQAQVHTIPVYLVGAVFSVVFAYMSEWLERRYYVYLLGWVVLASDLLVEIAPSRESKGAPLHRYVFFIACGCYLRHAD